MTFQDFGSSTDCPDRDTLLECALTCGVEISHVCGGEGSCGTCRVEVLEGWEGLSPQTLDETSREMTAPYRLACQASVRKEVVVRIAAVE